MEAFGNSLADSVSFRFPFRPTRGGAPLFRQSQRTVRARPTRQAGSRGRDGVTATVEA